jgi:DNA repair protein RecO (recombination protein O)
MAIQKTKGFVLRRFDIRETSVLLTAFTRDFGKLKFISKGVRIPEQRFLSAYELFALDEIVFYEKKRRDFYLLSQCELLDFFPEIRKSLDRISYAAYFTELLDSVTPVGEKNTRVYGLLFDSLGLLSGEASPKRVGRIFEIKLLSLLGFMPGVKSCVECDKAIKGESSAFSVSLGGVLCEACRGKDRKARPVLAGAVNFISHIEALAFDKIKHIKVTRRVGMEVERLLKNFIRYHLNIRLKSREFIDKVGV